MNMRGAMAVVAITAASLIAACSGGDKDEAVPADAQQMTVTVGDALTFDPPSITVEANRPVFVTMKNVGKTDHDFTVIEMPATGVKNEIKGSESHTGHGMQGVIVGHPKTNGDVTIRFTPTRAGTYEFYCSVAGHKDAGMKGTITVT